MVNGFLGQIDKEEGLPTEPTEPQKIYWFPCLLCVPWALIGMLSTRLLDARGLFANIA
jgi:hypothetical protein